LSSRVPFAVAAMALALALGGCTYDYIQRTDRVGYSAGDAVRANIERETADPHRRSVRSVTGLGKNGKVETAAPATVVAPL
jgi:DNA-binding transcriptional regulator LsrR (DeoR family)